MTLRSVYPFQVPGAEVKKAERETVPRDNFCANTQEGENTLEADRARPDGQATEQTGVKPESADGGGDVVSNPEDWAI